MVTMRTFSCCSITVSTNETVLTSLTNAIAERLFLGEASPHMPPTVSDKLSKPAAPSSATAIAQPCHALSTAEVLQTFDSHPANGLSAEDAAGRVQAMGWNELPEKPSRPAWLSFLFQFHDPLLYILLIAGAVKAALGSWTNACVIWGVTVINAVIGYVQESKAEGAIAHWQRPSRRKQQSYAMGKPYRYPQENLCRAISCC